MTDPAPSPPAGQPPAPHRPMPRLGGGLVWSDVVAKIEDDQSARDPEPVAELTDHSSTPSLGEAGSSLGDHLPPPNVAPWGTPLRGGRHLPSNPMPQPGYGQQLTAGNPPMPPAEYGPGAFGLPPGPAELLAMADDLNSHGGLDETFVAGLLQAAAGGSEGGDAPGGAAEELCTSCGKYPRLDGSDHCRYHALPGGIVEFHGELTEAELERLRTDFAKYRNAPTQELRPRPWWRRALDRVWRWGR